MDLSKADCFQEDPATRVPRPDDEAYSEIEVRSPSWIRWSATRG